jgi:hypothetical protein
LFISELLNEALSTDSPQFRAWFGNSKVVDASGQPLPVYHGTARGDRVGTRFRKSRATSGPMSYFTDDPEIASGYAAGKADTSHDPDVDYENWVNIYFGKKSLPLPQAWWQLDDQQRRVLTQRAPHITNDDDRIYYDENTDNGVGNYKQAIADKRGNVLAALVDSWLTSGLLFGDEDRFTEVLKLAGLTNRVWIFNPRASMPFVYQVFLSIQNPLITTAIPPQTIDALAKVAARQRYRRQPDWADQWDKRFADAKEWIARLLDEVNSDHAWTVIPDWVTATLQRLGYDGIKDVGGKNGGHGHTVWIPFAETQVKSAISNQKFDVMKPNIHQ